LSPGSALVLPLLFTALMRTGARYAPVHQFPRLLWSFLGTGAVLLAWNGVLLVSALRQRRRFTLEIVLRKQHYVQACAHTSILLYWGWYWRTVYESAFLIVAQILFAYAFDLLLTWSRRDTATLGFGPFPIVFSTNLFLWFRPDWFYLQFVMIALAFAGKELIRWNRDGQQTHVFNPSAFTLTVFSLALIVTGTSDIICHDIAVTCSAPRYCFVPDFCRQFLFGVTTTRRPPRRRVWPGYFADFIITSSFLPIGCSGMTCSLRSVHGAADRPGAHDLRRALWDQHDCVVCAPRHGRAAHLLRQAPASPAAQPVGQND
jgi:hypothetical protein